MSKQKTIEYFGRIGINILPSVDVQSFPTWLLCLVAGIGVLAAAVLSVFDTLMR